MAFFVDKPYSMIYCNTLKPRLVLLVVYQIKSKLSQQYQQLLYKKNSIHNISGL